MEKSKKYLKTRHWLNPKDHCDTGMISAEVTYESYCYVSANLEIWDCSRKIALDLGFDPRRYKDVAQRADKIDRIIKTLTEMRASMEKAYLENRLNGDEEDDSLLL